MGPENLSYENELESPQDQPDQKGEVLDGRKLKGLSDRERDQIKNKRKNAFDIKREAENAQRQAKDLLNMATGKKRLTGSEAKKYEERLKESHASADNSSAILEEIQRKLADAEKSQATDTKTELAKDDPDLLKAYDKYDEFIDDNEDVLGKNAATEYREWIRKQKPNLKTIQDLTVKFLQSERPPRVKTLDKLTQVLGKYGIKPLSVKYIKEEGHSERKEFLKNIEAGEKHFQKMGGMKEQLYSREAGQKIIEELCKAEDPKKQNQMLEQLTLLSREESQGYTVLKAATQGQKISQKSMGNILDYYKKLDTVDKRKENLKLWDSFAQAEAKLTDDLRTVFDKEPVNKEGFEIAFKMFKDMDFTEKENFIETVTKQREQEQSKEKENRNLTIQGFKHECTQAARKKTISESTAKNYHDWINKNSEGKSYEDVKKFYDILTSKEPNEQYKNLKAYEVRRTKFEEDVHRLQELNPTLTKEELKEWQDEYDKEGWNKREDVHKDLKAEIEKAKASRMGERLGSLNKNLLKRLREEDEDDEEDNLVILNKEAALSAVRDLMDLKAYGTAMKHCIKLLRINPADEDVLSLMEELAEYADQGKVAADQEKEEDIYDEYASLAHQQITGNKEMKMASDEVQVQEHGLGLARHDQEKRKTLTAHDRNKAEVMDKVRHDKTLTEIATDYIENAEDGELMDAETLGGKKAVRIDFDTEHTHEEKMKKRKEMYQEQAKADKHGGEGHGATVVEFKNRRTGKILDARSGMAAEQSQEKDKSDLADEVAKKIANIAHISGSDEDTSHLKLAKDAALDEINKKAHTKIERIAA